MSRIDPERDALTVARLRVLKHALCVGNFAAFERDLDQLAQAAARAALAGKYPPPPQPEVSQK